MYLTKVGTIAVSLKNCIRERVATISASVALLSIRYVGKLGASDKFFSSLFWSRRSGKEHRQVLK